MLHIISLVVLFALTLVSVAPAHCENPPSNKSSDARVSVSKRTGPDGRRWIKAKVVVHAPREVVWNSVKNARSGDPDLFHSRILEKTQDSATVQEKMRLPLIGSELYTVKVTQRPLERIDYKLLKSSRLKAYEGNWQILSGESDRSSILQLEHHVRLSFFVPSFLLDGFVERRLQRRLLNVKHFAEQTKTP